MYFAMGTEAAAAPPSRAGVSAVGGNPGMGLQQQQQRRRSRRFSYKGSGGTSGAGGSSSAAAGKQPLHQQRWSQWNENAQQQQWGKPSVTEEKGEADDNLNSSFMSLDGDEDMVAADNDKENMVNGRRKSLRKSAGGKSAGKPKKGPSQAQAQAQAQSVRKRLGSGAASSAEQKRNANAKKPRTCAETPSAEQGAATGSLDSSLLAEDDEVFDGKSRGRRRSARLSMGSKAAACKERGNALYAAQQYAEAAEAYAQAIALEPRNAVYHGNRAAARLMLGQYRACVADCGRALALDIGYAKARLRAARAYLGLGLTDEARENLDPMVKRSGGNPYCASARAEAAEIAQKCTELRRLEDSGDRALQLEDVEKCLRVAQESLALAPQSARAFMLMQAAGLLAAAKDSSRDSRAALFEVKAAVELAARNCSSRVEGDGGGAADAEHLANTLYHYGKALLFCALTNEARLLLTLARALSPGHHKVARRLALVDRMEHHLNAGTEAYSAGDHRAALAAFDAALALDANNHAFNGRVFFRRAAANNSLGRHRDAVQDCTNALRSIPGYFKARLRRAHARIQLGELPEAVRELEEASRAHPGEQLIDRELRSARKALDRAKQQEAAKQREAADRRRQQQQQREQQRQREEQREQQRRRHAPQEEPRHRYNTRSSVKKPRKRSSIEMLNTADHYAVLGVERRCSTAAIKKAFRQKALQYHPDKSSSPNAEKKFKRVNEAYTTLKSPAKRAEYDRSQHSFSFDYNRF